MSKQHHQEGMALFSALILSVIAGAMMTTMVISFTGQNKANTHSKTYDNAMMMAEVGIQRFVTGLTHENDGIKWSTVQGITAPPNSPPNGFWLWQWHPVKDANGNEIGQYRLEMLPMGAGNNGRKIRVKAYGQAYTHKVGSQPRNLSQRAIGVEFEQSSLADFAIASNHQLGGARINGGSTIHGGILTGGELHLDSSSTGIYNDYGELDEPETGGKKRSMFSGYNKPGNAPTPDAEVFIYKDDTATTTNNGMVKLASQAGFGTASSPLKAVHTAEDSTVKDPGGGGGDTAGDGIIGNGAGNHHNAKRDHKMPNVTFPDASLGSEFMTERAAEADSTLNASDLNFATSFTKGNLSYNKATKTLTISPDGSSVYITGNVSFPNEIKYSGKGGLFIEGNFTSEYGIEPVDKSKYPSDHALGITCTGDMKLGKGSGSSTEYAGFFFGNKSIGIEKANVYGNIFGNVVNLPTTGTRPTIIVHPEVMGETGVTLPDFTYPQLNKNLWWEFEGRDSRHS